MPQLNFGQLSDLAAAKPFIGEPIKDIQETNKFISDTYWQNKDTMDKLQIATDNIPSRDLNRPIVKQRVDNIRDKISEAANYNNFFYQTSAVREMSKDLATDKELQGVQQDYAAYQAWSKEMNDLVGKQDDKYSVYSRETVENMKNIIASDPKNNKQIFTDEEGNVQGVFQGRTISPDVDGSLMLSDFLEGAKANKYQLKDANGNVISTVKKTGVDGTTYDALVYTANQKELTHKELQDISTGYLMQQPKYRNHLLQQTDIQFRKNRDITTLTTGSLVDENGNSLVPQWKTDAATVINNSNPALYAKVDSNGNLEVFKRTPLYNKQNNFIGYAEYINGQSKFDLYDSEQVNLINNSPDENVKKDALGVVLKNSIANDILNRSVMPGVDKYDFYETDMELRNATADPTRSANGGGGGGGATVVTPVKKSVAQKFKTGEAYNILNVPETKEEWYKYNVEFTEKKNLLGQNITKLQADYKVEKNEAKKKDLLEKIDEAKNEYTNAMLNYRYVNNNILGTYIAATDVTVVPELKANNALAKEISTLNNNQLAVLDGLLASGKNKEDAKAFVKANIGNYFADYGGPSDDYWDKLQLDKLADLSDKIKNTLTVPNFDASTPNFLADMWNGKSSTFVPQDKMFAKYNPSLPFNLANVMNVFAKTLEYNSLEGTEHHLDKVIEKTKDVRTAINFYDMYRNSNVSVDKPNVQSTISKSGTDNLYNNFILSGNNKGLVNHRVYEVQEVNDVNKLVEVLEDDKLKEMFGSNDKRLATWSGITDDMPMTNIKDFEPSAEGNSYLHVFKQSAIAEKTEDGKTAGDITLTTNGKYYYVEDKDSKNFSNFIQANRDDLANTLVAYDNNGQGGEAKSGNLYELYTSMQSTVFENKADAACYILKDMPIGKTYSYNMELGRDDTGKNNISAITSLEKDNNGNTYWKVTPLVNGNPIVEGDGVISETYKHRSEYIAALESIQNHYTGNTKATLTQDMKIHKYKEINGVVNSVNYGTSGGQYGNTDNTSVNWAGIPADNSGKVNYNIFGATGNGKKLFYSTPEEAELAYDKTLQNITQGNISFWNTKLKAKYKKEGKTYPGDITKSTFKSFTANYVGEIDGAERRPYSALELVAQFNNKNWSKEKIKDMADNNSYEELLIVLQNEGISDPKGAIKKAYKAEEASPEAFRGAYGHGYKSLKLFPK